MKEEFLDIVNRNTGKRIPLTIFVNNKHAVGRGVPEGSTGLTWVRRKQTNIVCISVEPYGCRTLTSLEEIKNLIQMYTSKRIKISKILNNCILIIKKKRSWNRKIYLKINEELLKRLSHLQPWQAWHNFYNEIRNLNKQLKDVSTDEKEYAEYRIKYIETIASINELETEKKYLKHWASQNETSSINRSSEIIPKINNLGQWHSPC